MPLRRSNRRRLRRVLRRALLALLAAQVGVIAGLMSVDNYRKRVKQRTVEFPRTDPADLGVGESEVRVYTYGEDLYADMLAAIRGARRRVLFESYIVKNDRTGRAFKDALEDAARRGVEVYVIYDGFANLVVSRSFFAFSPRVHVLRYPAFRPGVLLDLRKGGRDHRKILAVDGEVGFVGGYNVGRLYATEWRDTHARVTGPSAWELENAFVDFWNAHSDEDAPDLDDEGADTWEPRLRVHRNVPAQLIYPIRGMYLEAIDRARDHLWITQAYFIPDGAIHTALLTAARRGVDVRLLVPETSNHVVADWLSRGFYSSLLEGGVTVWLFQDAMVHAKTMTIDGQWSTIGTANIDRLSMTGNYEVNLEVLDADVAEQLERVFTNDLTNARELTLAEWRSRPFVARFSELVLAPLRPFL